MARAAAARGFRVGRSTASAKRQDVMVRAAHLARERIEALATAMTLEQGKTLARSCLEVLPACEIIAWDAAEGRFAHLRARPSTHRMRERDR